MDGEVARKEKKREEYKCRGNGNLENKKWKWR